MEESHYAEENSKNARQLMIGTNVFEQEIPVYTIKLNYSLKRIPAFELLIANQQLAFTNIILIDPPYSLKITPGLRHSGWLQISKFA